MQQIKQIYQAALERGQRAAFLNEACAGDEALRREVESLLAYSTKAENFIEVPTLKVAAEILAENQVDALVGRQVGAYKVLEPLGAAKRADLVSGCALHRLQFRPRG